MIITVDRYISNDKATISNVYIDDLKVAVGLEDPYREEKIAKITRIPAGKYKVELRTEGGFHNKYSTRFPTWHEGMIHILDVPNYTWILHHIGNYPKDSEGCLLIGKSVAKSNKAILQSKVAYKKYYCQVVPYLKAGDDVWCEYLDNDR